MSYYVESVLANVVAHRGFQVSLLFALIYFIYDLIFRGVIKLHRKPCERKGEIDKRFLSWSITFFVVFILQFTDEPINSALIDADMEVMLRRRLFYFFKMCFGFTCIMSVYILHSLCRCVYSPATRYCIYILFTTMTINFIELVLRGFLNLNVFIPVYRFFGLLHYVALTLVLLSYPYYRIRVLRRKTIRLERKLT